MATLQELNHQQMNEAIRAGAERNVPATVTIRADESWRNLQSRLITLRDEHLLITMPRGDTGRWSHSFSPADKIGLSFKLKHHKHIFSATVAGTAHDDGAEPSEPMLSLCWPTRMHRLQRRVFLRVDVPENRIVRASFWLGGSEAEPAGTSPDRPVWSGRVSNLSAGGFQVFTDPEAARALEVGEPLGVRLVFGAGRDTVYADAQFRHVEHRGEQTLAGFQFLGLAHSSKGRQALQVITTKVSQFQKIQNPRARRSGAS